MAKVKAGSDFSSVAVRLADFSVRVGRFLLFAKALPSGDPSGRNGYRWYLAFATDTGNDVGTLLLKYGECRTETAARRAAFRAMTEAVKAMSQMVETWRQSESTVKAMI